MSKNIRIVPKPDKKILLPIAKLKLYSNLIVLKSVFTEEPLRYLHEIHDKIHQMRDLTLRTGGGDHLARFSTSCPSLCPLINIEGVAQANQAHQAADADGSDPDLLTNCSPNSSPTHYTGGLAGQIGIKILQGIDRRRSWADLEDSRHRRGSDHNHLLQAQNIVSRGPFTLLILLFYLDTVDSSLIICII